ncbi:MAG: O-antigen ligase family protein [Oscillatoriaceae bacterium SKW80]|nr:O-antigen ligase family protein [Oscillatoriaceae bacterium SKYG93]MCX8120689.1 O-antigen ligase family protein [Oscillatoriaceae bacterium SKW80]MDW8453773.1 O-antigen ligase [Oscillatoriaceae cyanobacterium SKYGB_i_bin93]HIK27003.1 O-antigen ligase family protein [Oscillatoriaceae cyanobacterium M7585_C2015_266]
MNVFTILSDILKFEREFIIFALLVFSKVLSMESRYVPSEGEGGGGGSSPFARIVVLLAYATEGICLLLMICRPKSTLRAFVRDPFVWGLMGTALLSFIWSDFPNQSRNRSISTLLTALVGLYIASRFSPQEQLRVVGDGMGVISVFCFVYTGIFPGAGREAGIHAGAWRGPLVHKNLLSQLATCACIPTLLAALDSKPKERWRTWTYFILAFLLVLLSTSKTGLIISLNLIMLVPLLKFMRLKSGVVIPLVLTLVLIGSSGITWLANNWDSFLYGLGKDPTLSGRTDVWDAAIYKIKQRPWFGYGYQAFWERTGGAEYIWTAVRYQASHAHNGFVNIALDLGLVGLFFFVVSILTLYIRGIAWLRMGDSYAEMWPILYASFLLLYNQTESTIIEHNSIFWVLHVAATLSIGYYRKLTPEERAMRESRRQGKLDLQIPKAIKSSGMSYEK